MSLAASVGFLARLGDEGVDAGIVAALLFGGILVAPLAAYLVRHLHVRVTGTLVGSLVIVTNSRTLLKAADWSGPARLAALVLLASGGAALVIAAVRRARAETTPELVAAGP